MVARLHCAEQSGRQPSSASHEKVSSWMKKWSRVLRPPTRPHRLLSCLLHIQKGLNVSEQMKRRCLSIGFFAHHTALREEEFQNEETKTEKSEQRHKGPRQTLCRSKEKRVYLRSFLRKASQGSEKTRYLCQCKELGLYLTGPQKAFFHHF